MGKLTDLTREQRFLLEWLAKEDSSALGECEGSALNTLIERGYATIGPMPDGHPRQYARVKVTETGFEMLKQER